MKEHFPPFAFLSTVLKTINCLKNTTKNNVIRIKNRKVQQRAFKHPRGPKKVPPWLEDNKEEKNGQVFNITKDGSFSLYPPGNLVGE